MNRRTLAMAAVVAVSSITACGPRTSSVATTIATSTTMAPTTTEAPTTAAPTTTEAPTTTAVPVTTEAPTTTVAPLVATINGAQVAMTSQLAVYDPGQKVWWLWLFADNVTCDSDVYSTPAATVFWNADAAAATKLPKLGAVDAPPIAFDYPNSPSGPFTANSGTALTFTSVSAEPGAQWTGHITVAPVTSTFDSGPKGGIDAIDGDFVATVCAPRSSM